MFFVPPHKMVDILKTTFNIDSILEGRDVGYCTVCSLPHFLSVPLVIFPPLSPPSSCPFSAQTQLAGHVCTYSYLPHQDTPRTSHIYYFL